MMKKRTLILQRNKPVEVNQGSSKSTKPPTLFDQTTKIEQKLLKLKQEIQEKKKHKSKQQLPVLQNEKYLRKASRPNNADAANRKVNISSEASQQLEQFLIKIGMQNYLQTLYDNGIDSLEILREVKQKQLEEIGISKGHALKIMVNLKKIIQASTRSKQSLEFQTKQTNSPKKSQKNNELKGFLGTSKGLEPQQSQKQLTKKAPLQIIIQTDPQIGIEQLPIEKKKYFCLYCYQVSTEQFCTSECEEGYNKMFEKYEKNLNRAQQLYGGKVQPIAQYVEQQDEDNEFFINFEFLDEPKNREADKQFNEKEYQQVIMMIKSKQDKSEVNQLLSRQNQEDQVQYQ